MMKCKQAALFGFTILFTHAALSVQIHDEIEVVFATSKGSFTLQLDSAKAPETVANFLRYVDAGFYHDTVFHRVIPSFVIQGGGFETGMKYKQPHAPVKNESANRLKNSRGSISMARRTHPDTATSQFYINLASNTQLDYRSDLQPGYTVFGKVIEGMEVIDKISSMPTHTVANKFTDVPRDDVIVKSAKRKHRTVVQTAKQKKFIAGEHYTVLDKPIATRNSKKIEVIEVFSYGCPHCYTFSPLLKEWGKQRAAAIDLWSFPAVWNKSMELYARAFYTADKLGIVKKTHLPLFNAIVIEQKTLSKESDLAEFFADQGVDKNVFTQAFNSAWVENQAKLAAARVRSYKPAGVPEIIVNGKYRIDRMRAGGMTEMLAVAEFLLNKERARLQQ
jgi:cyclophilin family peptidyl-prolyl cis-trans isomerase/predicted DsbA family dithiol-disulfide isomerase